MSDEHIELGNKLLTALKEDMPMELKLKILHAFASPIFFVSDSSENQTEHTKWNELIECLMAVCALSLDGNFSDAKNVTQMFAMIKYHCRGFV